MYLSKLTLHGFKSFAQKTELHYDPGVTAVVGPNGCGKSNIVDAVRWVTGEQRARILRSEKMDNVIFNGTARRRPLGMASLWPGLRHRGLGADYRQRLRRGPADARIRHRNTAGDVARRQRFQLL